MNDVQGLIERVEKAAGADREIDGLVHAQLLLGWDYAVFIPTEGYWFRQNEVERTPLVVRYDFGGDRIPDDEVPYYTASIDAALALAVRLVGDSWFSILLDAVRALGVAGTQGPEHLARYIILATLRALQATGRGK